MKDIIFKLRVNVKSLAAEGRIIREEIRKCRDGRERSSLHHHKMTRVKPEARLAQLALAFAKNMPYKVVENKTHQAPDIKRLHRKLKSFTEVDIVDLETWLTTE